MMPLPGTFRIGILWRLADVHSPDIVQVQVSGDVSIGTEWEQGSLLRAFFRASRKLALKFPMDAFKVTGVAPLSNGRTPIL